MNYKITGKEPYDKTKEFTIIVSARNEEHAKKYARWLHKLYKIKLTATPTNEDAKYFADRF
ncbi:MAG: hypothetical protein GY804_09895 [Alphaproteobacteria bacterium]|nr:hypothetical protein [Alphaproteobacteria bacterium]